MHGGTLVREARRRAGLTQAELAALAGTTQSAIARLERGRSAPSWERINDLVWMCGLEVQVSLGDAVDRSQSRRNLALTVDERWDKAVAYANFALDARAARVAAVTATSR